MDRRIRQLTQMKGELAALGPFDAILVDAPCSNTGVMRHRVDVKWRLQPGDLKKHPQQQLSLLQPENGMSVPA